MTEQEVQEAQKRADSIVDKVRTLLTLEDQVLAARITAHNLSENGDDIDNSLKGLEAQLEEAVGELSEIGDELKWATLCFRAYLLPRIVDLIENRDTFDSEEQGYLTSILSALTGGMSAEDSEQLASEIIARLEGNLQKTFGR